jgi:predicted RNA-binding protein YlxR (DUF448 family)
VTPDPESASARRATRDQRTRRADSVRATSSGAGLESTQRSAVEWYEVRSESSVTDRERGDESAALRRPAVPVRTCVGCRKREPAPELLRIVVYGCSTGDGTDTVTIVPDPQRRLSGRGAWLHPFSACLSTAVRRRAIGRALRVSGHLDISAVEQHLENRHEHS